MNHNTWSHGKLGQGTAVTQLSSLVETQQKHGLLLQHNYERYNPLLYHASLGSCSLVKAWS